MNQVYIRLVRAYAHNIRPYIRRAAHELCYGCLVDHPSQIQHDVCLMMQPQEQVEHCLDYAIRLMEEELDVEDGWTDQLRDDAIFLNHVIEELTML